MQKEVIAADEIIALAIRIDTYAGVLIEAGTLRADATHRGKANSRYFAGINRIEVIKNRTVIQLARIKAARSSPRHVTTDSQVVKKKKIGSEAGIDSSAERLGEMINISKVEIGCGLRMDAVNPKLEIDLLRMKCSRQ
jgi:hypothetical protein